ncbi:integrase [Kitasatospora sp. NPDC089509]|uniref:integrase n=1 Tax=Kitasatospora sp. NPDC089509 TaxID=3364079 RepID=UPI0038052A19
MSWRVFWVPRDATRHHGVRPTLVEGWEDLAQREEAVGVRAGDPIFLSPDYRVDPLLALFGQSRVFRGYTTETRRNYATDLVMLLTFLWGRGRVWPEATSRDLEDFEHWRRFAEENPRRVGGAKWNRELAAFTALFTWAASQRIVESSPIALRRTAGRFGAVSVPAARAADTRASNVHWLTPRTWRRWTEVGLRGHGRAGVPQCGWVGRLEDRNVAFVRLLTSSGLRRGEGGSLLTFEVPQRQAGGGRYCRGLVAAEVTRSKRPRTFYAECGAVGEVEAYVESSRAWAVTRAQEVGRYERLDEMRLVREVTAGRDPVVHWTDRRGRPGRLALNRLSARERMLLFTEGPGGPEPLWLWLNEQGLPFAVDSWDGVFRTANQRCARVLAPQGRRKLDPHKAYAPYATVHSARHSFALYMLVVLNHLMDRRFGLTPQERRDFRLLYGDPWFMVQILLGHASRETTIAHYLAPVADLQLWAMLAAADAGGTDAPAGSAAMPVAELDAVFTRIALHADGVQDIGESSAEGAGA